MTTNKYQGKILTFWQLLNDHNVEIPIIQRDYAQGREDKEEIRTNFLNALYNCLNKNIRIQLDFIYGSNVENVFQPLDGQQRLTTLFLLHWYAAVKAENIKQNELGILNKFSYETRITSRDFCKALINNTLSFHIDQELNFSSIIIDSSWFYLYWKKDPTIDSMLRTIDNINKIFCGISNLWERLISDERLIRFYYVELENIGLTDDLYIKMNARGKLLSSFENFKASFQKYINDYNWEYGKEPTDTFAFKIDTKWTEIFWKNFRRNNSIDEAFIRFISSIAMIRQSIEKAEDRISTISKLQDNPNTVRPDIFTQAGFNYLIECFEIYFDVFKDKRNINISFPLWRHNPKISLLSVIVYENNTLGQSNSASYTQKVLFYAQTAYLLKAKTFDSDYFNDWMRVIRNIVSRGNIEKSGKRPDIIRSPQTFDGVINLISELSEGCENIYDYLSLKDKFNSSFAKYQVDEEKTKSRLITTNTSYKKVIFDAEDNDLLMGRIEFLLHCIDFDSSRIETFDINKFVNVQRVLAEYFPNESVISNEFRRALLTIDVDGKYEYYGYWWSFWYVVSAHKRCLIDTFRELEYYIYTSYKDYFKKLIIQLAENNLSEIINNFIPPPEMPNWKKRLIKEPDLLNKNSKSNYIAIPDDNSCCYLLKSKRPRDIDGCEKIE